MQSGDSGGPIMYFSEVYRQWIIAGITSYGNSCGTVPQVGVYTRVSKYIDWIQSVVGKNGAVFVGKKYQNSDTSRTSRLIEYDAVNSSVISRSRKLVSLVFLFVSFSIRILAHIYQ